jgi:hypothetical protein
LSQEVVYIEPGRWVTEGYELEYVEVSDVPRAESLGLGVAPIGTAEAVPFQNNGSKSKQPIETSQLEFFV